MSMIWRDIWGGQQCGAAYDGCSDGTMAQELAPLPPTQTEADVLGDLQCVEECFHNVLDGRASLYGSSWALKEPFHF